MASHIVGYPRMGPKRELKFVLESFWDGKSSTEDLQKVAAKLRSSIWKQMAAAGIKYISSNTFSYYDQVLDTTTMLGAVPPRYNWNSGEIGFDVYFTPATEMTNWFDTNYLPFHHARDGCRCQVLLCFSHRVTNEAVQKAGAALRGSNHRQATNVGARLDAQQKKLNLPVLPTTTIGSFPQTIELRRVRREYKAKKISEEEYTNAIKEEIRKVVKLTRRS